MMDDIETDSPSVMRDLEHIDEYPKGGTYCVLGAKVVAILDIVISGVMFIAWITVGALIGWWGLTIPSSIMCLGAVWSICILVLKKPRWPPVVFVAWNALRVLVDIIIFGVVIGSWTWRNLKFESSGLYYFIAIGTPGLIVYIVIIWVIIILYSVFLAIMSYYLRSFHIEHKRKPAVVPTPGGVSYPEATTVPVQLAPAPVYPNYNQQQGGYYGQPQPSYPGVPMQPAYGYGYR